MDASEGARVGSTQAGKGPRTSEETVFLHGIVRNKNRPGHSLHEKNWHSRAPKQLLLDWATLQNLAEESFGRGRAILARVPTEKASEWEKCPYGPIVAVGNCGDVFLCSESCKWV